MPKVHRVGWASAAHEALVDFQDFRANQAARESRLKTAFQVSRVLVFLVHAVQKVSQAKTGRHLSKPWLRLISTSKMANQANQDDAVSQVDAVELDSMADQAPTVRTAS